MQFAAGQYLKAINIYPFCGKFFLVLASNPTITYTLSKSSFFSNYLIFIHIPNLFSKSLEALSHMNEDPFSAIYWCIRALESEQNYPCRESL